MSGKGDVKNYKDYESSEKGVLSEINQDIYKKCKYFNFSFNLLFTMPYVIPSYYRLVTEAKNGTVDYKSKLSVTFSNIIGVFLGNLGVAAQTFLYLDNPELLVIPAVTNALDLGYEKVYRSKEL